MKPSMRRKARRLALQAIYQWQHNPSENIESQFRKECNLKKIDVEYFSELVNGVINNTAKLDEQMLPFLDRPIKKINPVELAILRIAIYELIYRPDVPYKVIINEALEAAKVFGAEQGFKYINGILDKVVKKTRKPKT